MPALALVTVLCAAAAVVWINVAIDKATIDDEVRCTPAPAPKEGQTFAPLAYHALDGITPLPPAQISVRVLNAGSTFGQAGRTTEKLRELGFTQLGKAANDPAYADREADCHGQIRFGPKGKAAARTISLLAPCLELIKTNRPDAGVDVVVGTDFDEIDLDGKQRDALRQLKSWSGQHDATGGGEQAAGPDDPPIGSKLIGQIRDGTC